MAALLLLVLSLTLCSGAPFSRPVVRLRQGLVQGAQKKTTDNHFTYEEFLDIPYAAPPVGELRFRPPQQHQGWTGVLKTGREKGLKICPQASFFATPGEMMDEDCLTLDVYVPHGVAHVRYGKLPVMMFIHGGAFNWGSKNSYIGVGLIQRDVIYVAINYRLGVLGFSATGDEASPGNYGLIDQHFAIKWVRENIENFGGDPDEITIFGESAGSSSVLFQSVAPSNKGLFKRVVAQSGAMSCPFTLATTENALKSTTRLANAFNCFSTSTMVMMDCLRTIDGVTMANDALLRLWLFVNPVVDGDFILKSPEELYREGATENITILMGNNQHEGNLFLNFPGINIDKIRSVSPTVRKVFDVFFFNMLNADRNTEEGARLWTDFLTDYMFSSCIEREAKLHTRNGGALYRYLFRFQSTYHPFIGSTTPEWVLGTHGEELTYVFGFPCVDVTDLQSVPPVWAKPFGLQPQSPSAWLDRDVTMCHAMIDMWSNFAHTGNPMSGPCREFAAEWPLYTEESPKILEINEHLTTATGQDLLITTLDSLDKLRPRSLTFWNYLVPELIEHDQPKPCNLTAKPSP